MILGWTLGGDGGQGHLLGFGVVGDGQARLDQDLQADVAAHLGPFVMLSCEDGAETSAAADHLVDRASRARVRSPQSHRRSQSGEQFLTTRTPGEATFDLGLLVGQIVL